MHKNGRHSIFQKFKQLSTIWQRIRDFHCVYCCKIFKSLREWIPNHQNDYVLKAKNGALILNAFIFIASRQCFIQFAKSLKTKVKRFSFVKKLWWKGFIWNEKDSFWEQSTKTKMKRNSSLKWKGFIFEKQNEKKLKWKGFRATQIFQV